MTFEIVLEHREKQEVFSYVMTVPVTLEVFSKWLRDNVHPLTLTQMWYGDEPGNGIQDIIPICLRTEFGEIWRRDEHEVVNTHFYKGDWTLKET